MHIPYAHANSGVYYVNTPCVYTVTKRGLAMLPRSNFGYVLKACVPLLLVSVIGSIYVRIDSPLLFY